MIILSCFDGMSCGQIAFERAGIPIEKYYASEIDKYAITVTQANYPDTIQLGSITEWQSWKMSGCLFTGDYAKYSEAFPKSGIMLNGRIYGQATWAHRTKENEYGLLPTPRAQEIDDSNGDVCLESNSITRKTGKRFGASLTTIIKYQEKFPTPSASMMTIQDMEQARYSGNDPKRPKYKDLFPTPTVRDYKGGRCPETLEQSGRTKNNSLNDKVNSIEGVTGQLNPQWVDWLMGYPVGWTDLKDSEIQLSLK